MDNQGSGSFNANAGGGGGALAAAIARRSGALNQQGPGAAGGGAPLPPSLPTSAPQMVPSSSSPGNTGGAPQGSPQRVDDAHIILKAMAGRLKSQEKIAESNSIPPKIPTGGL